MLQWLQPYKVMGFEGCLPTRLVFEVWSRRVMRSAQEVVSCAARFCYIIPASCKPSTHVACLQVLRPITIRIVVHAVVLVCVICCRPGV